jgi:outer membrane receptor protein involved in Fe transport
MLCNRLYAILNKSRHLRFAGILTLCLLLATAVTAQTSRGTLTGTVADTTGAVIKGATVTITQAGTGVKRQTTTNASGIYRFDAVDLGTYQVSSTASGFATEDKTGVEIQAAHTTDIDFSLKVGVTREVVTVEATGVEVGLQTSEQVHSETFSTKEIATLPVLGGDSLTLAQMAPGIAIGSMANQNSINQQGTFFFAVNGQRPRGNNFTIDGVENNDISIGGPAFTISNPDAVQEVSVQTADFSAEYGRAGGAVFNQITKSGTNDIHGSVTEVYTGSAFKALNHLDRTVGHLTSAPRQVENIPDFTIGGPVVIPKLYNGHGKTFFFGAAQWDRRYGNITRSLRLPDANGVAVLQSLAAQCPNAALYLQALGSARGDPNASPSSTSIAVPSAAGTCDNSTRAGLAVTTGLFNRSAVSPFLDNNHVVRVDHSPSTKQTMSFRWLYDHATQTPGALNNLDGFDNNVIATAMSGLFTDTYMIGPRATNEFRFNYGRIGFDFPQAAADPFHHNLQNYVFQGAVLSPFGAATNIPQFRFANNWQYQDTVSLVRGKHTFRFGVDFLRQLARQHPPFNERGSFVYNASTGVTSLANFIDDFGGKSGTLNRQFGTSIYHPNLFRQAYFVQDSWKATTNFTLNIGLRYEYYGAPENTFTTPAFTNYDPVNFAAPNKVAGYKLNFGPSAGFAWNPKGSNWFNHAMGGEKMVWRGGFQTSYDSSFNNLLSNIAGSSPNTLGGIIVSPAAGRGSANFSALFAGIAPIPPTAQSPQQSLILGSFPNPQTDRWTLGFERELPYGLFWDTSYVGSVSHHLYQTLDLNPIVNPATVTRFDPQVGVRTVRAASANSNYESVQFNLKRNFKSTPLGEVLLDGSYTYAHYLDNISDVFGFDSTPSSFQAAPQVLGFSPHLDYGNSDFDRRHVGAIGILFSPRAPKNGVLGTVLGGWTLSGISHWQTGLPYTVQNGIDRGGFGQPLAERPDVSNPSAPLNTRATVSTTCATGFTNPDGPAGNCVDPTTVHFIEGGGGPNAKTVGRNTLIAPGVDNLDVAIAKRFKFTERLGFEFRADMFNALNTTNLGFFPFVSRAVNGSPSGSFLDFTQTDSIGRSMRMRVKIDW